MTLKLPDTGAEVLADGRRMVPSAARNAEPILQALQGLGLRGRLLEIASGSGLHAAHMAGPLGLLWQPTEVEPANFASITAWSATTDAAIQPPIHLDATEAGWAARLGAWDAVLLVNLLHLIPEPAAATLLAELGTALAPGGTACLYGPFLRDGLATSPGDAAFDASLRAQDAAIGYKDLAWVTGQLGKAGLSCDVLPMPANNLLLVVRHSSAPERL
jgi:SAM-dependent methyltransferase